MNIDQPTLNFIKRVIKCATIGKIDNVSIEPGKIRGMDDGQIAFIFHTDNVPEFDFGSIGFNRMSTFTARLDMVADMDKLTITANTDTSRNGDMFVRSLTMSAKGIKIDYRCANPAVIRAPRERADQIKFEINIDADAINYMSRGVTAMGSDEVRIVSDDNGTRFEMSDINGDVMVYQFKQNATDLSGEEDAIFDSTYPVKSILPLLKAATSSDCYITEPSGMLMMNVEGFDMYVFPRNTL